MMELDEPLPHTTHYQLGSWEEFQQLVASFEEPARKLWDDVWFRGQADARWPLHTTLERRSESIRKVAAYLNLIAEIKPTYGLGISLTLANGHRENLPRV
jgi:hypothetical protein